MGFIPQPLEVAKLIGAAWRGDGFQVAFYHRSKRLGELRGGQRQYLAESRGLGVSICYAAQAGSQLDAIYGPLQGRAIRDVTPAVLIMYGSHERELMESAAFWAGKSTRSSQSYNHNSDDKTTYFSFAGALEPEELLPRVSGEARLIPRGTPGRMVQLLDWSEFCCYLDEVQAARLSTAVVGSQMRWRTSHRNGE